MDYNCRDIPMKLDVNHQPLNFDIYLNHRIVIPKTCIEEKPYDFQIELDALEKVNTILERTVSSGVINNSQLSPTTDTTTDQTNIGEIEGVGLNHIFESGSPTIDTQTDLSSPPPIPPHKTLCNNQLSDSISIPPLDQAHPEISQSTNSFTTVTVQPTCPREMPLMPTKNPITATKTTNDSVDSTDHLSNSNSITQEQANKSDNIHKSDQGSQVNQINPRDFEDIHYNPFDHLELQTIDERRELGLVFQALHAKSSSDESSVHRNHL